jgi:hypothetical protein
MMSGWPRGAFLLLAGSILCFFADTSAVDSTGVDSARIVVDSAAGSTGGSNTDSTGGSKFCVTWYEDSLCEERIEPWDTAADSLCPDYRCTGFPGEMWGVVRHVTMPSETLHCIDTLCTLRNDSGEVSISWYYLQLKRRCLSLQLEEQMREIEEIRRLRQTTPDGEP